jgi:hypothetical protein
MNLRNEGNSNEAIEFHKILNSLEFSIPPSKHTLRVFFFIGKNLE